MTSEEIAAIEADSKRMSAVLWKIYMKYLRMDPEKFTDEQWKVFHDEIGNVYKDGGKAQFYADHYAQLIQAYIHLLSNNEPRETNYQLNLGGNENGKSRTARNESEA